MSTGREALTGSDENQVIEDETTLIDTTPTDVGVEEVAEETEEIEEDDKNESVRDTVLKEYKKLETQAQEGHGEESPKEEVRQRGPDGKFVKGQPKPQPQIDPEVDNPPERLTPEQKEIYKNLPPGLKEGYRRMIKDQEATFTTKSQEVAREKDEIRTIKEAVFPFAGDWAKHGHTVATGIAALADAHQKLLNPQTRGMTFVELGNDIQIDEASYIALGKARGFDLGTLGEKQNDSSTQVDITKNPAFTQLQENYNRLQSEIEQQRISPAVQEINAVRHEVDPASGRLKYPELKDERYLESLKPRVLELIESSQASSLSDALRKAAQEKRAELFPDYSTQPIQTRLPAAKPQTQRASTSAVSVRGRSAPIVSQQSSSEPPPEALANPRATVMWALQQSRRG